MYFFKLVFITQPKYLDTFLSNALRVAIGQLRISSHQRGIENGPTNRVPKEEWIRRLCHIEIEDEYHFTCKCHEHQVSNLRHDKGKIPRHIGPSPTLSIH